MFKMEQEEQIDKDIDEFDSKFYEHNPGLAKA